MENFTETNPAATIAALWTDTCGDIQPDEVTVEQMMAIWDVSESQASDRMGRMVRAGKLTLRKGRRPGDGHVVRLWRVNSG